MRLLAISDLHGNLDGARAALAAIRPDALLCCGDWGDPDQVDLTALRSISRMVPVYTVYGNHDNLDALRSWRNEDGGAVLLENGQVLRVGPLALVGINGIWAGGHRKPYHVTDSDVEEATLRAAGQGIRPDVLLTHGCPRGVADLTLAGRHAGQDCFLRAFQTLAPRVYLTGHLHRAQEYRTRAGQVVRNVGQTPRDPPTLLTVGPSGVDVRPVPLPAETGYGA